MVCIPCIVAPLFLWIWYRFIQPIVLKFWNPWAQKPVTQSEVELSGKTEAKCPFQKKEVATADVTNEEITTEDKKTL